MLLQQLSRVAWVTPEKLTTSTAPIVRSYKAGTLLTLSATAGIFIGTGLLSFGYMTAATSSEGVSPSSS